MKAMYGKEWRVPRLPGATVPARLTSNLIDEGSIYSIRRKHIAGRDMPMRERPPTPDEKRLLDVDLSQQSEQRYIRRSRVASSGTKTFKKQIIQNYNAPARDNGLGYRMPRPPNEKRDATEVAVENIRTKPTLIRTSTSDSLQRPVRCERHCHLLDAYCEILGPASCSSCIERTNKYISVELQRRLFPNIDASANSLVVPRVAEILCKGHVDLCRRARIQLPSMNNGHVDYLTHRKKSTVTDRFKRVQISVADVAQTSRSHQKSRAFVTTVSQNAVKEHRQSRVATSDPADPAAKGRRQSLAGTHGVTPSRRKNSRVSMPEGAQSGTQSHGKIQSSRRARKLGPGAKLPGLFLLLAAVVR